MAKKKTAGDVKKKLNATSKGDDNLIAELRLVKFDENNKEIKKGKDKPVIVKAQSPYKDFAHLQEVREQLAEEHGVPLERICFSQPADNRSKKDQKADKVKSDYTGAAPDLKAQPDVDVYTESKEAHDTRGILLVLEREKQDQYIAEQDTRRKLEKSAEGGIRDGLDTLIKEWAGIGPDGCVAPESQTDVFKDGPKDDIPRNAPIQSAAVTDYCNREISKTILGATVSPDAKYLIVKIDDDQVDQVDVTDLEPRDLQVIKEVKKSEHATKFGVNENRVTIDIKKGSNI